MLNHTPFLTVSAPPKPEKPAFPGSKPEKPSFPGPRD